MNRKKEIYNLKSKVVAVFMALTLLWLTVSISFTSSAQQQQTSSTSAPSDEELPGSEDSNPFGNNTEEKAETSNSGLSEYLNYIHELIHPAGSLHKHNSSHDFDVYVAFHGELLCPPPNFILS